MVSNGARGNRVRWKGIRGIFNVVFVGCRLLCFGGDI